MEVEEVEKAKCLRKEIITIEDMCQILEGYSYDLACKVIRQVKKVSDVLKIKGCIHKIDWEIYLHRNQNLKEKEGLNL